MIHTFVAYVENKPGVLNRVASLFRRRAYNIESLAVGPAHLPGVSRMTIEVEAANDDIARQIAANLYKLVDILHVDDLTHRKSVKRALALVKVDTSSPQVRSEIIQITSIFKQAEIIDAAPNSLILEIVGYEDTVERFIRMLEPYRILEMQRTGVVGMLRGSEPVSEGLAALEEQQ
jgi:acetolactate synthase-1/3 small subunit